jgi:uncharacterized radical SAM superfamily protein
VAFHDDLFILSPDWLEEFSGRFPHEVGLPFSCHVRADLVTPQVVQNLKRAGCAVARMGIELANPQKRRQLLRRYMTNEQMREACALLRGAGIRLHTYNILGLPQTTVEDDLETLQFNIECRADIASAFIFKPYPKTELSELARKAGLWDGNVNVDCEGPSGLCLLTLEHRAEVEMLQRLFFWTVRFPVLLPVTRMLLKWARKPLFRKLLPVITKAGEVFSIQQHFRDRSYHH